MSEILHFFAPITATDTPGRRISGRIVPFGEAGNTSAGPVTFAADAFTQLDPANVKLLLEHDSASPIGRALTFSSTAAGIDGTFSIAKTSRGNDALIEASDGLRDGLSVGVSVQSSTQAENGSLLVTAATLIEVSLVTTPAFSTARVADVAASTPPTPPVQDATMTETSIEEVAADPVDVLAPITTTPIAYTAPRVNLELTAGQYTLASIKAAQGDPDARDIMAALAQTSTSNISGLVPVPYMREIIGIVDNSRPFIDSMDKAALPGSGMTFRIPKWTTQPTVAQTASAVQPSSTGGVIDDLTVTVVKFAGANRISIETIDRTDPAYFDELVRVLASKYAQAIDTYAIAQAKVGAVATSLVSPTITGTVSILARAISDSYGVMRMTPNRIMVAPDKWASIISEKDSTGRPLYYATNPSNAAGVVNGVSGDVMGLGLVVDPNATAADCLVYPSNALTFYEQSGAPARISVTQVSSLEVDVAVYGYVAVAAKYPTAVRTAAI
ncbi:MAG: phage major capsid protein [Planctomycetota bacterium]